MFTNLFNRNPSDPDLKKFRKLIENKEILNWIERVNLGDRRLPIDIATDAQECIYLSQRITSKADINFKILLASARSNDWKLIEERLSIHSKLLERYKESVSDKLDSIIEWADKFKLPNLKNFDSMRYKETGIPRDKHKLLNLNYIHLPDVQLTYIPPEISVLPHIQAICLSDNKIDQLPSTIYKMKNVFALDLENNAIKSIPDEIIEMTSLTSIDLDGNDVCKLSSNLLKMPKLNKIYLRHQQHGFHLHYTDSPLSELDQKTLAILANNQNIELRI